MKFYDTNVLLEYGNDIIAFGEKFYISYYTLVELENIKRSAAKDEDTKYKARTLLRALSQNSNLYEVIDFDAKTKRYLDKFKLPDNTDSKIIYCAYSKFKKEPDLIFVTFDLSCKMLAECVGLNVDYGINIDQNNNYTGFLEIDFTDETLENFYSELLPKNINQYNLLDNQYLIMWYNEEITDYYKWTEESGYIKIKRFKPNSSYFGKISPQDVFQIIALDSLDTNNITMLRGPAGSGKSYLAFGYMFDLLERGEIDKIIIFCNTVATKGSAKLGFYPGSRTEKLLDSQIGNLLASKLGDRIAVERLISENKLVLLPLSDIRGYDTSDMHAAVYISEAQNMDIELMKLALQRIGEDSICILDGDDKTQVDMDMYAGRRNGMKRVSQVFRGHSFYGEIELQRIFRSQIADLANKL